MKIAITRSVSARMGQCELTFLPRTPIDLALARAQHRAYEQALEQSGCQVITLPEEPELPDSVFIEDTAIVLDELAIITRPGAESRRGETAAVARALSVYRDLRWLQAPATLDGGDVMRVERTVYVGQSSRSNPLAIEQLQHWLVPWGYQVVGVPVRECLHLKSAVTQVSDSTLLLNPRWVAPEAFPGMDYIFVDETEPFGANVVWVNSQVIYSASFPHTLERLRRHGLAVRALEVSETEKAEGAVTCCSLLFDVLNPVTTS